MGRLQSENYYEAFMHLYTPSVKNSSPKKLMYLRSYVVLVFKPFGNWKSCSNMGISGGKILNQSKKYCTIVIFTILYYMIFHFCSKFDKLKFTLLNI